MEQNKQQILSFFNDLIRTTEIEDEVKSVRASLNLPKNGLVFSEKYKSEFDSYLCGDVYIPSDIQEITGLNSLVFFNLILSCSKIIHESTGLVGGNLPRLLRFYIIFNEINENLLTQNRETETIRINDIDDDLGFYYIAKSKRDLRFVLETIEERGKVYPLNLQFNPHVSKKQLKDFIDTNWDYIKSMRNHYGSDTITKLRKRSPEIQARNDFIYKNRDEGLEDIMKLVARKFVNLPEKERFLDMSAISTIKNNEIKKRSEKYKAT